MKRFIGAIFAVAVLGLAGVANAGESRGKVEAVDAPSRTIVLDDGNNYVVGNGVAIETLRPGIEVKVTYEEQSGQRVVTDIQPTQ